LSHVNTWANQRMETLAFLLDSKEQIREIDFSDDRLANLLDRLADDHTWNEFEKALSRSMIKVYNLSDELNVIRTDSYNATQHRKPIGLIQLGYSKDRPSDMPFMKVMMSMLDEGMLPLSVDILKGSGTDANHYLPIIKRTYDLFEGDSNLYVGDSQFGSLNNRSTIQTDGHAYLMPLNRKQCNASKLVSYIEQINIPYTELDSVYGDDTSKRKIAYYYEIEPVTMTDKEQHSWQERRILVLSPDYRNGSIKMLNERIEKAKISIQQLVIPKSGRRKITSLSDLKSRVNDFLKKYKVTKLLNISYHEEKIETEKKAYKDKPARIEISYKYSLDIQPDQDAIDTLKKHTGWQVYACNMPKEKIDTKTIVLKYRDEYKIEHLFDYMINKDVGLLPIFLHKENRIKGLIRLLTIAMRFVMRMQHQIRKQLKQDGDQLKDVYPGNPGRATDKPTTRMILKVFKGVSMVIENEHKKIPPLSRIQLKILRLFKIPDSYRLILELSDS